MVEFSITDIQLIDGPADAKRSTKVRMNFILIFIFEYMYIIWGFMDNFVIIINFLNQKQIFFNMFLRVSDKEGFLCAKAH